MSCRLKPKPARTVFLHTVNLHESFLWAECTERIEVADVDTLFCLLKSFSQQFI